jgi:hypothetical protein
MRLWVRWSAWLCLQRLMAIKFTNQYALYNFFQLSAKRITSPCES